MRKEDQSAIVEFLAASETYGGAQVERVDTHISHIFLAGDRAYKLKRAVRTNYLDFSSAELRRLSCERELQVNAAVAGGLYRRVVPIVRREGALHLGGSGTPVDWVVEMARFDQATEFDRLAEKGALDVPLVEALADVVAAMHDAAPRLQDCGGADATRATIRQIVGAVEASPQAGGLSALLHEWRTLAEDACDKHQAKLDSRRRHGFVRRCHGDLHLGNICLVNGRPTPFDALEFNEEMASTDILYDVAFTVMDLVERGLRVEAGAFLSRYLSAQQIYSGLALMPLFISMRAAVRCLVAASRNEAAPGEPSAEHRLQFAIQSLARADAPRLVAIGGLSGSGKSSVARYVAPDLGGGFGAIVLRSDVTRKRLYGVRPEVRLGSEAYRPEITERVYVKLGKFAARILRAGVSVVLDAAFLSVENRKYAATIASKLEVGFTGAWLVCPPEKLKERIITREGDASDADLGVLEVQLSQEPSVEDWTAIDASGDMPKTVKNAHAALGLNRMVQDG